MGFNSGFKGLKCDKQSTWYVHEIILKFYRPTLAYIDINFNIKHYLKNKVKKLSNIKTNLIQGTLSTTEICCFLIRKGILTL